MIIFVQTLIEFHKDLGTVIMPVLIPHGSYGNMVMT